MNVSKSSIPNHSPLPSRRSAAVATPMEFNKYLLKPREIQIGEITGYRLWYVQDGYLKGTYQQEYIWKPGINVTELPSRRKSFLNTYERKNDEHWGAGFHAFKKINEVYDYFTLGCGKYLTWAFGSIYMWGDVIEAIHGYRSSHAAIRSIDFLYLGDNTNNLTASKILNPNYHNKLNPNYHDKLINQLYSKHLILKSLNVDPYEDVKQFKIIER